MDIVKQAPKTPRAVRLNTSDNVIVAVDNIEPGVTVLDVKAKQRVPRGHKMAAKEIRQGEPITKFGQVIGFAKSPIGTGEWVHEHNVEMHDFARDYAFAQDAREEEVLPVSEQATFQGYRRPNGKVGTRN